MTSITTMNQIPLLLKTSLNKGAWKKKTEKIFSQCTVKTHIIPVH